MFEEATMKSALFVSTLLCLVISTAAPVRAGEGKDKAAKAEGKESSEVTLKGDMVCAKCALHEAKKCQNVLKVDEAGKEAKYYLTDNQTAKQNHETICSGKAVKATVTGKVKEAKGKKVLTASSITYE
jgi:hypothetical protein